MFKYLADYIQIEIKNFKQVSYRLYTNRNKNTSNTHEYTEIDTYTINKTSIQLKHEYNTIYKDFTDYLVLLDLSALNYFLFRNA